MVSDQQLCQAFERVDQARQQVALTYFEFGTLAALDIFADAGLDLLILEVGLGGRLDAVNIIDPDVALITTVDLDHLDWLGTTREEIGLEKAGIMRAGKPVVLAHEMPESVYRQARELATDEYRWGQHFQFELTRSGFSWTGGRHRYHNLPRPALPGACQVQNAAAVLMVCECLSAKLSVDEAAISRGLQTVRLPGRMQILPGRPRIILDVAHNPQAVQNLVDNLSAQSLPGSLHAVFGILSDKDLAAIVQIIAPRLMSWHLVDTPGPRGQSAEQLKCRLTTLGVEHNIHACGSLDRALKSATEQAGQDASILIFGSFLVVGDFLNSLNKQALN
jgi:dihydrofolate synthase/folylpolyglutamate synthase